MPGTRAGIDNPAPTAVAEGVVTRGAEGAEGARRAKTKIARGRGKSE